MGKRMIRDWTGSETMDALSLEAEVFFTRLIMKADDYGNYTGNIKLINAALFPLKGYDPYDVQGWLDECAKAGLVLLYEVDKRPLIHIKNFDQKLRRMHAVYPPPSDGQARTVDGQVTDKRPPEEKRSRREDEVELEGVTFDELFLRAFDERTCEVLMMTFKEIPAEAWGPELQAFRTKCDLSPEDYHKRDVPGLRKAFQYQLKNYRHGKRVTKISDKHAELSRILAGRFGAEGAKQA